MSLRPTLYRLATVAVLVAAVPSLSAAQSPALANGPDSIATTPMPTTSDHVTAAPRRDASVAGVRLQVTAEAPRPLAPAQAHVGRGQALAIVGGAAFIGGLIIGDDAGKVIAIGGLCVGIYGLWLWLK